MVPRLAPIQQCEEVAGLAPDEILLGVTPSARHERLLGKYCRGRRTHAILRAKIVHDLRKALACGASDEAADLLIVLRWLLALEPARASLARAVPSRRRIRLRDRAEWRSAAPEAPTADLLEREEGEIIALESVVQWKKRAIIVV